MINDIVPISVVADSYLNELDYRGRHQGEPLGLSTGIQSLDKLLGDMRGGEIILLGGRPAMGKSSFTIQCISRIAQQFQQENQTLQKHKKCILFFNWGMPNQTLLQRLMMKGLPNVKRQELSSYRYGLNNDDEFEEVALQTNSIKKLPIYTCENICPLEQIEAKINHLNKTEQVSFIVIDYLLIPYENDSGDKVYKRFMPAIKKIAGKFNVPILILSQLHYSLEYRFNKRPVPTDIYKHWQILPYVDKLMLLYREYYYIACDPPIQRKNESYQKFQERMDYWEDKKNELENQCEIIVQNKKDGICGMTRCGYRIENSEFYEFSYDTE